MKVKVSDNKSLNKVLTLSNDASLRDLIGDIGEAVSVAALRFGYPPMTVQVQEDTLESKLDDLGVSSGEKVVLITNGSPSSQGDVGNKDQRIQSLSTSNKKTLHTDEKSTIISLPSVGDIRLQVHEVPDDNSCLFHALSYCIYKDISLSQELRSVVSQEILNNKAKYNDAVLERPNSEYAKWIMRKESWGGGIEIAILSESMHTAVYVLDIDAQKFEKFNEDQFDQFVIVLFNGVHYDALELDRGRTVFDRKDEFESSLILSGALSIAAQMKKSGHSFNTTKDSIICNICKKILMGEREVAKHAESTGHVDFGQC